MKKYIIWIISILKFFLLKKRFLLMSPIFLKRQYWYDRKSKSFFTTFNRNEVDWNTSWQVFLDDQYTYNISRTLDLSNYLDEQNSKGKKPLIIDCGSNSGVSCIYFSLTYPQSRVIGLEISKDNYLHSKKNIEINNLNIEIINKGISCENGFGELVNIREGNNAYRIKKIDDQTGIPMISIDSVIKDHLDEDNFFLFIIKIDIEGGEEDLFKKNIEWVNKTPKIIIELHDWHMPKQKTSKNFLQTISKQDRDFIISGENIFSINNKLIDDK